MSKKFTNKNSFSLIRTNPKLTGNIKLVCDSKGDIYVETFDGSAELSSNKYKKIKLDINNNWSSVLYRFFGEIPQNLMYSLQDNEDFFSVKSNFAEQYYTNYQQGATPKISKLYDEQISYLAPIWLEPNDVPEYFAIFKIPNPVSVNTSNLDDITNVNIEKQIYNTNYLLPETESSYFFDTILSTAKLHKVFDLSETTTLGKFLKNHTSDNNFPESSLTINWNQKTTSTINGISLDKSGFVQESFNLFDNAFPVDKTITEFDNFITKQFEDKKVIHPNIINIEFLFDDENDSDFSVNRYFGVYFNRNDISKFKLNANDFYLKKYENIEQNHEIESTETVDITKNNSLLLKNTNGVKLFVDYENNYALKSSDVNKSNFIPYVYSTDGIFYDIHNNQDWNTNELVLKTTNANIKDFKGFTKNSVGIIPCSQNKVQGRSSFVFSLIDNIGSLELRIKNVNEFSSDFNINTVFVGDAGLDKGTFYTNKFSLKGNQLDVVSAIVSCINNYSDSDDDFNVFSCAIGNKVVIFTRGSNEYWNNYEILLFSKENNTKDNIIVPFQKFISIQEYNTKRTQANLPEFLDYDTLVVQGTSMFSTSSFQILHSNFIGGNNNTDNKIKVHVDFLEYFNHNLYLKTDSWYTKITSIGPYLDEPVFRNNKIVNFNNFNNYFTVHTSEKILLSNNSNCELYDLETNKIGLMSFYPLKQFDTDQFRSEYGKDADGDILKLEKNYKLKDKDILSIQNNINNFKETGFKKLCGTINETTNEIPVISNEYDRLKENELSELAIKGRIIPYINKWVYDDSGKDVRENEYRLNANSAFSYDNFSPSDSNYLPDFRFYTHEWYYLQEYPPYLSTQEKINSFSYFERYLEKNELYNTTEDLYEKYFTQNSIDGKCFPTKRQYSNISGGSKDFYAETFFRGVKIKFKKRTETNTALNFNVNDISTYKSSDFNGYKFSCVLTNKTENPLKFTLVENKKFKSITFFIECNLDDYFLTRDNANKLFFDRSSLYVLESKYDQDGKFSDILISGAITPFVYNNNTLVPNFEIKDNLYIIQGVKNVNNSSLPNFIKQILPNEQGKFNKLEIQFSENSKLIIDDIKSVTIDTIRAKKFYFLQDGTTYHISTNYNGNIPLPQNCTDKKPIYIEGGFGTYKGLIQDISFASIFDKVNNASPDIIYETVNEDGTISKNTFIIEFEKYTTNVKADYLETEPMIYNNITNSDFKPIGSLLKGLNKTYFSTMFRHNGNYNPKVTDLFIFKEDFGSRFTPEIQNNLKYTNVQFFSSYPGFCLYRQLYFNKINEQNPMTILESNKDKITNPTFWKTDNIPIDKTDWYIFRSSWDFNYHKRYLNKNKYISLPGYIEPTEKNSFLGSTIMNIPNQIKLQKYNLENITYTENSVNVSGVIDNTTELIQQLTPHLFVLFEKYVNPKFNYKKIDTFDDDIEKYITSNILPRYFTINIYAYYKYQSKTLNENTVIVNNKSEQELMLSGFNKLENINFTKVSNSNFNYKFSFNKPSDKSVILSFVTNISVL